jgi:hypothetical protein
MPCPIIKEPNAGVFISILTVAPSAIITLSPAAGTTPPTQVAGAVQRPPVDVEVIAVAILEKFETLLAVTEDDLSVGWDLAAKNDRRKKTGKNLPANLYKYNIPALWPWLYLITGDFCRKGCIKL